MTINTVELKTSTGGTRTEQIKTGYSSVHDYSKYLHIKYRYMNTGTTSMQGVPTTVSVSNVFLKKCMNDPKKAKYLEENLKVIPDCVKSLVNYTKTMQGSPVCTYATYIMDDDGNITCMSDCTNDPHGKIARENAEKKAREEEIAKRRGEKKEAKEVRTEKGDYTITATGTDIKAVTQKAIAASLGTSGPTGASFDIKA